MAGFREFQTGEVLTAGNVNDYLMQQAVMKFADATARDTALGTAVGGSNALREGMVAWLDSSDELQAYDGTSWSSVGGLPLGTATPTDGQILAYGTATSTWNPTAQLAGIGTNVVTDIETATYTESVAGAGESAAVLSASITPTSATSKVLVQVTVNGGFGLSGLYNTITFITKRDGTAVGVGNADGSRARVTGTQAGTSTDSNLGATASAAFLDSPASASSLTYTVVLFNNTSSTRTLYLNRTPGDSEAAQRPRMISSLILTEVAV